MRLPDGWTYVSDYCIKRDDFTICRVGGAEGYRYELWNLTEQLVVNLPSAQAAIEALNETSQIP